MRPIKPNTRRRSLWRGVLLSLGAIVIGGVGTVLVLAGLKVIDPAKLAFWRSQEAHKESHPAGWIGIPYSARSIPAYTTVTREYLKNPKTGELILNWVPPEAVPKGIITDPSRILKRVMAHDMPALYCFAERDFLPVGTRPGIVGGVPLGKRAYTFNASNLEGCVYQVREGDHVDLMVSVPVDMPGAGHAAGVGVIATPDTLLRPKRTLEIPLVQDGVVVSPVTARIVATTNSSLMGGTSIRNARVEEIVIAVAPEEVAPLDEAKALKHKLTCVARSGRPAPAPAPAAQRQSGGTAQGGMSRVLAALGKALLGTGNPSAATTSKTGPPPGKAITVNPMKGEAPAKDRVALDITPGLNPMADVRFMELMIGARRQFVLFNGPGNSPVVQPPDDGSAKPAPAATPAASPGAAPAAAAEQGEE